MGQSLIPGTFFSSNCAEICDPEANATTALGLGGEPEANVADASRIPTRGALGGEIDGAIPRQERIHHHHG
jgi:hypothetical protein